MIILYIIGIIMMIFGILSIASLHNIEDDELPAPKEQMIISALLITLIGLFSFIMARITDNFIEEHYSNTQNNINIIK